jgi:hypothetical protein
VILSADTVLRLQQMGVFLDEEVGTNAGAILQRGDQGMGATSRLGYYSGKGHWKVDPVRKYLNAYVGWCRAIHLVQCERRGYSSHLE